MRFKGELGDLEKVRFYGREHGYGNCIQYLQHAWMKDLIRQGISREGAAVAVGLTADEANQIILAEDYT